MGFLKHLDIFKSKKSKSAFSLSASPSASHLPLGGCGIGEPLEASPVMGRHSNVERGQRPSKSSFQGSRSLAEDTSNNSHNVLNTVTRKVILESNFDSIIRDGFKMGDQGQKVTTLKVTLTPNNARTSRYVC